VGRRDRPVRDGLEETDAFEEIEATYGTDDAVVAQLVVRDESGDVLTRDSLLEAAPATGCPAKTGT